MNAQLSRGVFATLVFLFGAASVTLAVRGEIAHQSFKAFYCAGKAVALRADPYHVEPLRACEHELAGDTMAEGAVEPAPLPGYGLATFALLSVLPAPIAAIVFALTMTLAVALSALAVSRILGVEKNAVFLACTPLAFLNLGYGEIPPYSLLGLSGAAYYLTREKYTAAAALAAFSLIQPTLGVAAVAAMLLFVPRARVPMLAAIAVLVLVSLAALGVHGNIEYFARVLPLQSESELAAADQYGLAHVLFVGGLSSALSLTIARIVFALGLLGGLILGRELAQRTGRIAYVVLLPPVSALLFGLYVHDIEVLAAIPAALLVARDARTPWAFAAAIASLALLCAVWTQRLGVVWVVIDFTAVAAAVYAVRPSRARLTSALAVATLTMVCAFAVLRIAAPPDRTEVAVASIHAKADDFAPSAWKNYIEDSPALTGARYAPAAPTWMGLTLLVLAAALVFYAKPLRIA